MDLKKPDESIVEAVPSESLLKEVEEKVISEELTEIP
jgi:hypothetical protein